MPTPDRDLIPPMPPHVASEFLLWLAYREAMGDEVYTVNGEPCMVLLEEEVELKRPEEEKPSVVLRGVGKAEHPELLASLKAGRVLHRAKLFLHSGDREYRLVLTGPQLQWSGVKLPRVVKGGDLSLIHI
jgi:hypothetical protein